MVSSIKTPADFDENYAAVRKLVLQGRITLAQARCWMADYASKLMKNEEAEREKFRKLVWSKRINRDHVWFERNEEESK